MRTSPTGLTRQQTLAVAILTVFVAVGVVWLMVSMFGGDTSPTSTTATTVPTPTDTTTTVLETTTTSVPVTTATVGIFDEVEAVEAFIEEFAGAIEAADSAFLFESLHPAVKATYQEGECRAHIDDRVLSREGYRQEGPVVGPLDAEFGEFPITSYEALVTFDIDGETLEETGVFSLTEGVVRWFAECS